MRRLNLDHAAEEVINVVETGLVNFGCVAKCRKINARYLVSVFLFFAHLRQQERYSTYCSTKTAEAF